MIDWADFPDNEIFDVELPSASVSTGPPPSNRPTLSVSRPPMPNSGSSSSDIPLQRPLCLCGLPCQTRTVKVPTNQGKKFWRCGVEGNSICDFFQFHDASAPAEGPSSYSRPLANSSVNTIVPTKRLASDQREGSFTTSSRRCHCDMTAILNGTVWMCPKVSKKVRCKYMEKANPEVLHGTMMDRQAGTSSGTKGACFKVSVALEVFASSWNKTSRQISVAKRDIGHNVSPPEFESCPFPDFFTYSLSKR